MVRWEDSYRAIEQQANCFAAGLLMPFHDFRTQIAARAKPSLEELSACAQRYGVSLIAATLRWLEYAERRSVLVVSRDGYILWARSSKSALKTGAYFKTVGRPAIPVPTASLAVQTAFAETTMTAEHDTAWFGEPSIEISLASDHYDFVLSLIHLEEAAWQPRDEFEEVDDVFDRMSAGQK